MTIFDALTLLGGLAMFLYGMRLMGDSLKEGSSGALKTVIGKLTDNPVKAFFLGLLVTAIIQSSTATIVITSGLVAAGVLTLHQSVGILVGANVGTTVTGQIIRLLDIGDSAASWLQFLKPATLAPVAMIIGIVLIMFLKLKNSRTLGNVAMGFGILFSGLLNMTGAVDSLATSGVFDQFFAGLDGSPLVGYITGAGVAFVLQSSSASVGILQAFSMSGMLSWKSIYAVIVGIYLGDCVTTHIVCAIGAREEPRRVGVVNLLFNLGKSALVLIGVTVLHQMHLLDGLWETPVNSGIIANTNTIFNIASALLLFPFLRYFEKGSRKLVKDRPAPENPYADQLAALNIAFFKTPALALSACRRALMTMLEIATDNIRRAFSLLQAYDPKLMEEVSREEDNLDFLTDKISTYLVALFPHVKLQDQVRTMDQYYKVVTEFERLGDHAMNLAETAESMQMNSVTFSETARQELAVLESLIRQILDYARMAFGYNDVEAARHIEPLEEVCDDLINALKESHISRLQRGECEIRSGADFLNLLQDVERISDRCSNIGVETVTRNDEGLELQAHDYISQLHAGRNEQFNLEYQQGHDEYFRRLAEVTEIKN